MGAEREARKRGAVKGTEWEEIEDRLKKISPASAQELFPSVDSTFQRRMKFSEVERILAKPRAERLAELGEAIKRLDRLGAFKALSAHEEMELRKLWESAQDAGGVDRLPLADHVRYLQLHFMDRGDYEPLDAEDAKRLAVVQAKIDRMAREDWPGKKGLKLTSGDKKTLLQLMKKRGAELEKPEE